MDSYLDPYVYSKGRKITVAGELLGDEVRPLGEMDYRYPLVFSKQLYLWEYYYYYPYPDYYPGWYYNPWSPWWGWGYPYRLGIGFRLPISPPSPPSLKPLAHHVMGHLQIGLRAERFPEKSKSN